MKSSIFLASALILSAAAPAAAQEWEVNRRFFTFLDNEVTVEVSAESGGRLHVIRGEEGRIEVSARVDGGMSSFALGGRDGSTLRITAVGGEHAEVILVVPEDTYLRVMLPNSRRGEIASSRPSGTFVWPGPDGAEPSAARMAPAPMDPATAHISDEAPRVLDVPRLWRTNATGAHLVQRQTHGASALRRLEHPPLPLRLGTRPPPQTLAPSPQNAPRRRHRGRLAH